MSWDQNRPDGTKALNLIDNDLRDNHATLTTRLAVEHYFADGATSDMRHKIGRGNDTARDAAIAAPAAGNIWLNNKDVATHGWYVLQVHDGSSWVDCGPYDIVAYVGDTNDFTNGQIGSYVSVTPGAGTPMTLDWDLDDGNYFKATITASTILNNPSDGSVSYQPDKGSTYVWQLLHSGAVPWTLTYGAAFKPAFGSQPNLRQVASATSILTLTMLSTKTFIYRMEHLV